MDHPAHAVLEEIARHPRGDDLARLAHAVTFAMADERRTTFEAGLEEAMLAHGLTEAAADTSYGNALRALAQREPPGAAARKLLGGLVARGLALDAPSGPDAEARVAETLVWLAAQTPIDALPFLDLALGERARGLWLALATLVRRWDEGMAPLIGRAGALVAAAALGASSSSVARTEARALAVAVRDPAIPRLLSGAASATPGSDGELTARGQLMPAPWGSVATVLLAVTGVFLVLGAGRLCARYVLRHRRDAEVRASARGITLVVRSELLGRDLAARETFFPVEGLARAVREVRYPRLGLYAGLIALALGTYFGASWLVSGAQSGSPGLLGLGALGIALGLVVDYALTVLGATGKTRCRLLLVPRKGRAVAVGELPIATADALLARISGR